VVDGSLNVFSVVGQWYFIFKVSVSISAFLHVSLSRLEESEGTL